MPHCLTEHQMDSDNLIWCKACKAYEMDEYGRLHSVLELNFICFSWYELLDYKLKNKSEELYFVKDVYRCFNEKDLFHLEKPTFSYV